MKESAELNVEIVSLIKSKRRDPKPKGRGAVAGITESTANVQATADSDRSHGGSAHLSEVLMPLRRAPAAQDGETNIDGLHDPLIDLNAHAFNDSHDSVDNPEDTENSNDVEPGLVDSESEVSESDFGQDGHVDPTSSSDSGGREPEVFTARPLLRRRRKTKRAKRDPAISEDKPNQNHCAADQRQRDALIDVVKEFRNEAEAHKAEMR